MRYFHRAGLYRTLLEEWLPDLCESEDKARRGNALNWVGTTSYALGDYDTALDYLKKSLAIQQEIGDAAGLCATLFNMGFIHWQNEEKAEAMRAWVTVYGIAKKIGHAQALQALESLGNQLSPGQGLGVWERMGG